MLCRCADTRTIVVRVLPGGTAEAPPDITLTGVGYDTPGSDSGRLAAPLDASGRWDDEEPGPVVQMSATGYDLSSLVRGAPRFIFFHDACWTLFESVYHPDPVPLSRFWEAFTGFGGPHATLHGSLHQTRNWTVTGAWRRDTLLPAPSRAAELISNLLPFPCMTAPDLGHYHRAGTRAECDPFYRLPLQLLLQIALDLATSCVKNHRLSSRTFWCLFHCDQFWASRFLGRRHERAWFPVSASLSSPLLKSHDSGFLGHAEERIRPALAWRDLYWPTGVDRIPVQWRNRRRVWQLARALNMLLCLQQVSFRPRNVVPVNVPIYLLDSILPSTRLTNTPSGTQHQAAETVSEN